MSRNFNACMWDAGEEEESRRPCVSEHGSIASCSLEQRSCDHEEESLKGKAQTDHYRNQYLQTQVELSKVNSNYNSSTNPKESSLEFQNLLTSINSSSLQTELFRETLAKEHWKNLYFQSQAWLLKVYSLWKNLRKELQENIGYLAVDSTSDNDANLGLKREINVLSLVLDELHVQAEFLQQQENQQTHLFPRDVFSGELEQNECWHYMLSEGESEDHYVPKVQTPSVSFEINSSGSKQKEIYAGKAQTSKDTNYRVVDTESVENFFSVREDPDFELRQRISLEEKHNREQTLDSLRFVVPEEEEESNQGFLLLERHCDHRSGLVKETAKKDYYKRRYIKSQAELYKMFSKLEKFNICFEKNVTEFENVSLSCLNLQKEIFKVKSEKEHYINQFLQFHAELLRVHSMWQDLKIKLENKMIEFESTSPSCSANQYLCSYIDRLSSALDELLNQLEASRQNIDQSQYSAMANKKLAKGTLSAELEQCEQRNHKFLDSEDNQYDDSEEQDLNVSFRRIVSDSAEDMIFAVQENVGQKFEENMPESSSSSEDSFEKVDENIKFERKPEEKLYKLVDPKDRFSEETDYDKRGLYMIWEEEYEVSDTTESEPEQISGLEVELAEQKHYTQRSQGSEMLWVPDEVPIKPLLEKQKVYHLEAELSNERVEKDFYKKLYNESQAVVFQLHVEVDKCNLHYIDKLAVPERSISSRNNDDENVNDSIKGIWESVDKINFHVQTIKQLVDILNTFPAPKEVLSIKATTLQTDLRNIFDAPQPGQLEITAPESDQELITKLVLLQQKICDLEVQLSKEKDQRNHYNKLYNELEAELLKMNTALDKMNHKYEGRTAVSDTACSSGSYGNDYVDKNVKPAWKSECTENIKKLAKPNETNMKDTFPLESDQSVHSSTFLDANRGELDLSNLQHPSDTMEMVPESVSEDTTFAKQKELEDTIPEDFIVPDHHYVCVTKAEITHLHSLQQRNDDLEEELLKEKDEKDYYKKLYNEAQPELFELRAMQDNFLLKSEEMAKTANTCMNVEESKERISNETISSKAEHKESTSYMFVDPDNKELVVPTLQDSNVIVEIHAQQPAQIETSAATTEGSRYTHYISMDTNCQHPGTSLHITSPECDQEQISTLGGGSLKGTQDTERSKESQILRQLEAETNKVFSLHQRVSALESELSEEKDQKYYYSNLSSELRAELLKLRAILENNSQESTHETVVPNTSSSSEGDGNDYENKNIQAARKFAGELECEVKKVSELSEMLKKLENQMGKFPSETDQNVQISTALDAEHENQDVCTTEAEVTELLSIKQRNDDLEEELLKEKDEKDYYKKLYDEEHPELLELRAMRDNFLLKSEEMTKTADTCMIVEEPKEAISNETISSDVEPEEYTSYTFLDTEIDDPYVPTLQDSSDAVETHAPQPAQLETSAATTEEPRGTHYVSLDTNFQNSSTSLDITAPECDQEQIFTLGGGPLTGTQDTEQSKESQSLWRTQAEISTGFSLYQRVSDLDTEVSREREQKDYYHKLYNESQVELLKLRAILEKTAVPDTASSYGNYDNDYVDENIKATRKSADELECEVQNLSELTETMNKLAEPQKTNLRGTFSLETDQSAHSSTFLDAKQDDHDVPNLQHPSDSMETTVPESVSEDTSFATPKKFEDSKSEEFTMSEEEKSRISLDVEAPEFDQEQISTSDVDVLQQRPDMEERNEEEITQLSSEQHSVCDLEVDVLANASTTGSDNAELLHLPPDVLQLQIDSSEQSDAIPNQVMPTEVIPSATLVISTQDSANSDLSEAHENQTMPQEREVSFEVTTPECEQVEVFTPVREQHEQNQDTSFTTDRDATVETIIPEEETVVIEAENRNEIRPLISFAPSESRAETGELTESTSLGLSFSETEDDVFDRYRQHHQTPSQTNCSTCLLERSSSSEELRQDDRVQENLQVRRRNTPRHLGGHPVEGAVSSAVRRHLPNVFRSSIHFIKYIVVTFALSFLGAYICHEYIFARPQFDVNYGLFKLLEPFCTLENVLPVPF